MFTVFTTWTEWIGIIASIIILISFVFKEVVVIRILNMIGSVVFTAYGILINAFPIWFLNVMVFIVNLLFVVKILMEKVKEKRSPKPNTENETSSKQ